MSPTALNLDTSPENERLRVALITLGPDLARRAYPEIGDLDLR